MEPFHRNLANQVIATLNTLNENIISLGDSLISAGFGGDKMEKKKLDIGQAEDDPNDTKDQVEGQN